MSGHSKWSNIKNQKAATDARRGQLFTKLAKEIIVATRKGGGDPDTNFRLRIAVQRAKDRNMPTDNIERAIKRGGGDDSAQYQMTEAVYEGYGPGGIAILLHTLTDNRNRTASDVRSTLSKNGGSLSTAGSVVWQFEQKGVLEVDVGSQNVDELAIAAIDAGADDFEADDGTLLLYSTPSNMEAVRASLAERGVSIKSSELAMVPKNTVALDDKAARSTLKLLDRLEELDDVQRVFSNANFPDLVLQEYRNEV